MTISSRPYADEDLPRLQDALAVWRREAGLCGYCHVGDLANRIYEGLRGDRPVGELVRLWENGSGIVGVAICLRFGAALDVFTAPALRGTGAEFGMLGSALETTSRHMSMPGSGERWVITDVYGCDHARAELLIRLGFERYRVFDHIAERDLREAIASPELPGGFLLRRADAGDAEQLAEARNSAFGAEWSADSFRDQVMTKPGYGPERQLVVVTVGGRVAAFTVTWLDQVNKVGHFEPVGTHRDFRRRGLARAMMLHGLGQMRNLGMDAATVEYDATNLPARSLYAGLGFVKRYETFGFRRPADS